MYEDMIRSVVQGLDTYHLQYLASVAVPVPNQNMDDINGGANGGKVCLTAVAKEILQKCFLFVGRYELEDANVEYLSADSGEYFILQIFCSPIIKVYCPTIN